MKKVVFHQLIIAGILFLAGPLFSQTYIADYSVAKEEVLREIPVQYIDKAKDELNKLHDSEYKQSLNYLTDYIAPNPLAVQKPIGS